MNLKNEESRDASRVRPERLEGNTHMGALPRLFRAPIRRNSSTLAEGSNE